MADDDFNRQRQALDELRNRSVAVTANQAMTAVQQETATRSAWAIEETSARTAAMDTEVTARTAAMNAEIAARTYADTQEGQTRAAADTALGNRVTAIEGNFTRKFATNFGNGALTSFTFTHNFNTTDVLVQVFVAATGGLLTPQSVAKTVNTVTITFTLAVATNANRVVIIG